MQTDPPQNPVGPFSEPARFTEESRAESISELERLPSHLRDAVMGLNDDQLDVVYRNWTIRQIVHHIADSHMNSYIRFKWALTEDVPTIKAYDEGLWSDLTESRTGHLEPSLQLLDGLHARWCQLLKTLSPHDFERSFLHPETGSTVSLNAALPYYAWHGQHHTGQILWLRSNRM